MRIIPFILSKSICISSLSLHQVYINSCAWKCLKKSLNIFAYIMINSRCIPATSQHLYSWEKSNRMDEQCAPASSEWSLHQDPRACHEALLSFSEDSWPAWCNTSDGWQLWHLEWCFWTPTLLIMYSESVAKTCMHSLNLSYAKVTRGTHGVTYLGGLFLCFLWFTIFYIILFTS